VATASATRRFPPRGEAQAKLAAVVSPSVKIRNPHEYITRRKDLVVIECFGGIENIRLDEGGDDAGAGR